ncbi:hypothetical protein EI555_018618, partial [Monodon monoceros]
IPLCRVYTGLRALNPLRGWDKPAEPPRLGAPSPGDKDFFVPLSNYMNVSHSPTQPPAVPNLPALEVKLFIQDLSCFAIRSSITGKLGWERHPKTSLSSLTLVPPVSGSRPVFEDLFSSNTPSQVSWPERQEAHWGDLFPPVTAPSPSDLGLHHRFNPKASSSFRPNGTKDPGAADGGELVLGGSDPAHYIPPLTFVLVTIPAYWQIHMERVEVGTGLTLCARGCAAILDTGTSLITGPTEEIRALQAAIGGVPLLMREYLIQCLKIPTLPPVSFLLGGVWFNLNVNLKGPGLRHPGSGHASARRAPLRGDVFLGTYVAVFDRGDRKSGARVGLGRARAPGAGQ